MPKQSTIQEVLEQQRPRAARHEAGHAVVALLVGLELRGVLIAQDGTGSCDFSFDLWLWEGLSLELWTSPELRDTWRPRLERDVLTLLAGNAAEDLQHDAGTWADWIAESDYMPFPDEVSDEWFAARMVDRFCAFSGDDQVSLLLRLQAQAQGLVSDSEGAIGLVAKSLLEHGRLSPEEVKALVKIASSQAQADGRTES